MPSANRAAAATLAAMSLAACGTTAKPVAGTLRADAKARKQVDDPRTKHIACLRGARIPVVTVGQTELEVGTPPTQAKIVYTPTPGSGQQAQIGGDAPGAELIGSALLYPEQDSDAQLQVIEGCLTIGVKG
jgi:hypothetical protein